MKTFFMVKKQLLKTNAGKQRQQRLNLMATEMIYPTLFGHTVEGFNDSFPKVYCQTQVEITFLIIQYSKDKCKCYKTTIKNL